MTAEDRKRQQTYEGALRSDFHDLGMRRLIKNPGFTVPLFVEEATRLVELANQVTSEHAARLKEDNHAEMSDDDKIIIRDAKNATALLEAIKRIGA
jgi:hypothetical protein